jgi:hypothetical protein
MDLNTVDAGAKPLDRSEPEIEPEDASLNQKMSR